MNEGARPRTSLWLLLSAIVVSGVTTFMFYPLVSLELLGREVGPAGVGLILGLLSGTGPIVSVALGRLNARWGSRSLAIGGLVLRSAGLLVFAWESAGVLLYCVGAVVASLGSGATALAIKTELMRTSLSRRTITLRSIAVNIGALIGPAVGGAIFTVAEFGAIIRVVVVVYVVLAAALLVVRFHPPEEGAAEEGAAEPVAGASGALAAGAGPGGAAGPRLDGPFLALLACTAAYWAIYAQWPLVMPVYAEAGLGSPVAATWVYTGNAVLILALQYLLLVKVLSGVRATRVLAGGFVVFVGAVSVFALPAGVATVIAFAALFSLAELLVSPTLDELTGRLRPDGAGMTRAYGLTGTVGGVASLVGSAAGGVLIEAAGGPAGAVYAGVLLGLIGLGGAAWISRREVRL